MKEGLDGRWGCKLETGKKASDMLAGATTRLGVAFSFSFLSVCFFESCLHKHTASALLEGDKTEREKEIVWKGEGAHWALVCMS